MGLYKLFSCNVEIQYKSCLLSKAMLFTFITTVLNIILPFIIAHRSRGFWLRSHSFYEQPVIRFTYEHLLIADTDDPSQFLICGESTLLSENNFSSDENCIETQTQIYDNNDDGKDDTLEFGFLLNVPLGRQITSITIILGLDYQLQTVCPLHMQSLAVIYKTFSSPTSGFIYYGDIEFNQITHLACLKNTIDTYYNTSVLKSKKSNNDNLVDFVLKLYYERQVTTQVKELFSRSQNGPTSKLKLDLNFRVPETQIKYKPSLMQELKWAWPQYLSLVIIFYWIFNRIKRFVFNNRLLMAWKVVPWKKTC